MNEVNRTLFIPLYGKAQVSRKKIILDDPTAERIWDVEAFPIRGKSKSKWLAYNMAMRARVFDDWTEKMLKEEPDALVLHVGCGLDSRNKRVRQPYQNWIDADLPDVIAVRRKYYEESENYHMVALDACDPESIQSLPESHTVILVLEGLSMYLSHEQLHAFFAALEKRYANLHVLMDIYTEFGARASKYKNPINDVGVTLVYGIDDINDVLKGLKLHCIKEHSFTPDHLVEEISPKERWFFKLMFTGRAYGKIYRLIELAS